MIMVDVGPLEPVDVPFEGVEEYVSQLDLLLGQPLQARNAAGEIVIDETIVSPGMIVLRDIAAERAAQDIKWGEQNHRDGTGGHTLEVIAQASREICKHAASNGTVTWKMILQEEVSEAFAETDTARLRAELVQVAATAAAWIQAIDRRMGVAAYCEAADAHRMAHVPTGVPPTPAAHDVPGSE
jgi:hypothetical protein